MMLLNLLRNGFSSDNRYSVVNLPVRQPQPLRHFRATHPPISNVAVDAAVHYPAAPSPSRHPVSVHAESRLALDWLFGTDKGKSLSERVLARLIQAEARELDPHLRDDYRQAFIAASFAAKGIAAPFVAASYAMYGVHPDKLFPAILARRAALLGPKPDIAQHKKPARSVVEISSAKERAK